MHSSNYVQRKRKRKITNNAKKGIIIMTAVTKNMNLGRHKQVCHNHIYYYFKYGEN